MDVYGVLQYLVGFLIAGGIYALLCLALNVQWCYGVLFHAVIAGFFGVGSFTSSLRPAASRGGQPSRATASFGRKRCGRECFHDADHPRKCRIRHVARTRYKRIPQTGTRLAGAGVASSSSSRHRRRGIRDGDARSLSGWKMRAIGDSLK